MKELKREISYLTSTTNLSLLRRSESRCLATFSFDKVNEEVKLFAPLFHKMVSTITKESCIGTAVTSCIALKSANTHMSAFQHVIGQVLDHGGATDETIDTLAKMSISVSATRKGQQNLLERQKKHISNLLENELSTQNTCKSDIIGDNIDILRSPSQMSVEKKRQSWHWFLLVGLEKRIFATGLDNTKPIANICQVENGIFIPNMEDSSFLEQNFIYHIMQVLVKHVDTLRKYTPFIPQFISHEHIDASCRKSDYAIIDLLNKSENKSEEMIEILEYVHDKCIGKSDEETQAHLKMRVFGGDVLTNERAYSAQLALHNGTSELDRLQCVIHRPEGLHRIMNHLLFIYQQFYKVTSAGEPGTLSHLRNTVGRVDVRGPDEVIQKYRSHYAFVEDCLDAFIVGAYMHLSGTQNLQTESPLQQTMFNFLSDEQKYTFIHKLAKDILDKYVKTDIHNIRRKTDALDTQSSQLKDMYCSEKMKYVCPICNKLYKTKGGMKRHLNKEHGFSFELGDENSTTEKDHIATYRASFMTCALLLRDTNDAYKMGDGNRITVNAKFQMLLARVGKHTKYQLWLFRYLAYIKCLLTPQMAYEYMWNCSANLQGGLGRNIPNDNLVEILVQTVKKKVYCQGANASYASVRKAALTTQIQEEIKENLQSQCDKKKSGSKRPKANKTSDILEMVSELNAAQMFDSIPGREFRSFSGFEDLFTRVNVSELHSWITENRERLSYEVLN
ncbi:hypothetical protein FSP39_012234 [Pinctada imbricata]|uniref:C2H2-type domain-containing protein n=1 Tax=Pinctada imbricata TaxID=66713 RepID=A0AA88XIV6_PINIB|nr:hypothetical protein FSP39_012234 [Pinctada imbricata]